jgi:DNA-binding CsgD family transcriptional regulator/PAS domain-containing protein
VTRAADWLGTSEQFVPFAELERTEFYNDLLLPYGMPHAAFGMLERGPSRVANLGIYRSHRAGPFEEHVLDLIRFLRPHIKRAYRLHSHLALSRSQRASLQSALDSLTMGVILLAPKGQVVTMNRAAERFLADNDGLQATREGLRAQRADESARLQQLVAEATTTSAVAGLRPAGVLTVSRQNRPLLQLLISPVRGFDVGEAHPVRAIVFVTDPARRVRTTHDTLRVLFGLTPAEYRLAMLLADGHGPPAIAEMVGVSRNTVKSHLASIYRKTNTSRQAQLVRLLLQLPGTSLSVKLKSNA